MPCFARAFVRLCALVCTFVHVYRCYIHTTSIYLSIYTHIHIHVCVQIYIDTFNLRKLGRKELSMQEQHESPPTLNPARDFKLAVSKVRPQNMGRPK